MDILPENYTFEASPMQRYITKIYIGSIGAAGSRRTFPHFFTTSLYRKLNVGISELDNETFFSALSFNVSHPTPTTGLLSRSPDLIMLDNFPAETQSAPPPSN